MNQPSKPIDIAKQCGVTTNSIRNWSREFALHLSPGANAPERHYSGRDAVVLRYIATLKTEGMKGHAIAERLAETSFGEVESAADSHELAKESASDGLQQAPPSVVTVDMIISLQRQIEAIQQARSNDVRIRRDAVQWFAAGFLVAAFLFLGMIVLSWLYGG